MHISSQVKFNKEEQQDYMPKKKTIRTFGVSDKIAPPSVSVSLKRLIKGKRWPVPLAKVDMVANSGKRCFSR